jgi:hypothetical protein
MNLINKITCTAILITACVAFNSCQKMDRPKLGDYARDTNPPGGPLKFYTAFDGSDVDSIRANFALNNPLKFVTGVNKQAIQGERGKALRYPSANDWKQSTSFTIAWWMKSTPHAGGPEFLFSLTDKDYWHNSSVFLLIEDQGQSNATEATVKFALQDQWFEFVGANKFPGDILNGSWHHLAIVYDQATSKLTYYVDGTALTGLPDNLTKVNNPVNLKNGGNFIISGWNKHAGAEGPGDDWIQSYSGAMDQFRLYGKALTASEVLALFNSKL